MGFFDNIVKSLFGSKSDRDYKEMQPIVAEINGEYEKLKSLSNDELRNKTVNFVRVLQSIFRLSTKKFLT